MVGILSLLLVCFGIFFIKKKLIFDGIGKVVIIVVSLILVDIELFSFINVFYVF